MTAPNPLPSPADAWFCARCGVHRTSTPTRLCPVCADDDKRATESQR